MANINISQIRMKRGNTAASSTYVGPLGELLVDTGLKTIRVQDGSTAGGMSTLATYQQLANVAADVANIQANTSGLYSNANVGSYLPVYSGTVGTSLINFTNSNAQVSSGQAGTPNTSWVEMTANIHNDISGFYADENAAMQIYSAQDINFYTNTIGSSPIWTLKTDGSMTLPAGTSIAETTWGSSYTTLTNTGNPHNSILGLAYTDNIGVWLQARSFNGTDLDDITIKAQDIILAADDYNFEFTYDGKFGLPNGATLNGAAAVGVFATDNTQTSAVDLRDSSGRGFYTDGSGYTLRSSGTKNWIFDTSGNLTVPGSILGITNLQTSGTVTIGGNLIVNGNTTTVNASNLIISDNIVYFADGNPANTLDIGIAGHFNNGRYQHTGLVRQASTGQWKLFSNVVPEPGNTIDFTNAVYDAIQVGNITSPTITDLYSNAAAQATSITTLTANAASQATDITTLYANAAAQANSLTGANAAIVTANTGMKSYVDAVTTAWTANAATQQTAINTLQANVGSFYTYANLNYGTSSYANANVASYLPTYSGNISNISFASGNLNLGGIQTPADQTGTIYNVKGIVGLTASSGANISGFSYISAGAVRTDSHQFANGVNILSTIAPSSSYSNVNVAAYIPTDPTVTAFQANVGSFYTWANTNYGTSSYANANVAAYLTVGTSGNIKTTANLVAPNYLFANGVNILSTIAASSSYGDSNVISLLSGNTVSNISLTSNASIAGNLTVGTGSGGLLFRKLAGGTGAAIYNTNVTPGVTNYNMLTDGASLTFNTASGGSIYTGINNTIVTTVAATGLTVTGNVTAGNIIANQYGNSIGTSATYSGNVTAGNVVTTGTYVVANITTTGAYGNITGANVISANTISATNFVYSANGQSVLTGIGGTYSNTNVAAYLTTQTFYSNSNVSSYLTANPQVGTYSNANVASYIAATTFSSVSASVLNSVGQINGTLIYIQTNGTNNFLFDSSGNLVLPTGGAINYANGRNILTGISSGGTTYSNANVVANLQNYVTAISTTANIATTANIISPNYLFANGVNILSTVTGGSGTYSNTNVAAYLTANPINSVANGGSSFTIGSSGGNGVFQIGGVQTATVAQGSLAVIGNISATANITANYFVGNGAALTGLNYASIGNIYGTSSNVTLQAGSYSWTLDNTGNLVIPTNGNIIYANGTVFSSGTGGSGGTTYTNANVVSMLAANSAVYIGNTGNVATVYPLQSNITQVFIGGNTTLTSGNAASPNSTFLMYNAYFAANGAILTRNTTTGVGYISVDSTGIGFGGYTGAVTANTVPTFNQFLRMNGSIGAQFSGSINTPGSVTGVGLISTNGLTLNTLGQISTNQASASIFPTSASTIAIGGVATTVTIGPTSGASNVFVSNAVGTNNGNLTVRAFGTWNTLTLSGIAGGYNSPPYSNQALTGGSGTGMTANYTTAGNGYVTQASLVVVNPGTGYKNGDVLTLPGGIGTTVILTNYNSSKSSSGTAVTGLADYVFGMDGNLSLPGNVTHAANTTIYGDFSNSTFNYRTVFRTTTANATTGIYAVPNGTSTGAAWQAANNSNIANASKIMITTNGSTDVQLVSGINGTGTYLPLSFLTGGNTQMQLDIGGNLNMVANGNVTTAGNIVAGNYLFSNGVSILSTVSAGGSTYSNANVVANLANFVTNIVSTANITAGNLIGTQYGNTVGTTATFSGNITAANIVTTGATSGNISGANWISANTFQVSNGIFWANGTAWSSAGGSSSSISNGTSSLTFASSGGNGVFQIGGVQTATFSQAAISMIGNISATANITAANIIANQFGNSVGTTATYSGNVTAANVIANQFGNSLGTTATYTGNVTAANIVTTGTYGNITNANVIFANTVVVGGVSLTRATNGYNNWKGNTYANIDNISCSVFSNGAPAFSSVGGTLNYYWSSISNLTGGKFWGNTNTGGVVTTYPTTVGTGITISSGGDTVQLTLQDQDLKRIYSVTYVQTVGSSNCAIVAERIL